MICNNIHNTSHGSQLTLFSESGLWALDEGFSKHEKRRPIMNFIISYFVHQTFVTTNLNRNLI